MLMIDLGPAADEHMVVVEVGSSIAVGDVAMLWGPEDTDVEGCGLVLLAELVATPKTTQSALT